MGLSNAFGLLQILIFLGYGLVTVPKHAKQMTSLEKRQNITLCSVDLYED